MKKFLYRAIYVKTGEQLDQSYNKAYLLKWVERYLSGDEEREILIRKEKKDETES